MPRRLRHGLRFLSRDRLPDGRWRYRFRWRGKLTPLPGEPGQPAFHAAYAAALAEATGRHAPPAHGSFGELVALYVERERTASPATMKQRRSLLGRLAKEHGHRVALMPADAIRRILFRLETTPAAAANTLKALRAMYRWGVARGLVDADPTEGIRWTVPDTGGFTAWTPDDLRRFVAHHPPGTTAHLAIMLAVFTAARRSDLVRLGRQHVRTVDGIEVLEWRQTKGGRMVTVPILPPLAEALARVPPDRLVFLHTDLGQPFTVAGFGARMAKWTAAAGLPGLTAHGVRKAAGALLAEAGCTPHEIAAILGHSDPRTSSIYTRSASQWLLARSAMAKMKDVRF